MNKEIENLVLLSKKGDKKAKEEILNRLYPLIISSIRRYYNKVHEYDDLIQDGYEVVLRCIQDYDFNKEVYFLGYVKAKLKYLYLNKHREKLLISLNAPVEDGEIVDLIADDENGIDSIFEKEDIIKLYNSLNSITDRQRQIIIHFYIHNLSIDQIAEKLGISYRTVVNIKTTALKKLKGLMVK